MSDWFGHHPHYVKATIVTIHIVFVCVGVIGNVMVSLVILRTKELRNSTNIFLLNLSIADLIFVLVLGPTLLMEIMYDLGTWTTGVVQCKSYWFLVKTLLYASVWTIVALSFERYYAICQPLKAGYICTNTRAAVICALVWFFAALLASPIPVILSFENIEIDNGTIVRLCFKPRGIVWYELYFIIIVLTFTIPFIILVVLYIFIVKNLMTTSAIIAQNANDTNNSSNVIKYRKKVILMLGTVIIFYFICFLPFEMTRLTEILDIEAVIDLFGIVRLKNFTGFGKFMQIWHSGINPILYNLMSSKFRAGFVELLKINKLMRSCKTSSENIQCQDTSNTTITTISTVLKSRKDHTIIF